VAWIGMLRPDEAEIRAVAQEFGLHSLAVEDTINAHQRPKLERYGDVLFVVLRPARTSTRSRSSRSRGHLFLGPTSSSPSATPRSPTSARSAPASKPTRRC